MNFEAEVTRISNGSIELTPALSNVLNAKRIQAGNRVRVAIEVIPEQLPEARTLTPAELEVALAETQQEIR